jgi:hypothetical protein
MRQTDLLRTTLKHSMSSHFFNTRPSSLSSDADMVNSKYVIYIIQHTKALQGPRIYIEEKQYVTSTQLFKVATRRLKFFLPHSPSGLIHTSDSVDGDLLPRDRRLASPIRDDYEKSLAVTPYILSLSSIKMNAYHNARPGRVYCCLGPKATRTTEPRWSQVD